MAKRGKHFAEKWWGSTGSPTENLYLDNCLKKRLQRQWYGILKENALLGNFQRAPQTHYKPLPMKLKCLVCGENIGDAKAIFFSMEYDCVR